MHSSREQQSSGQIVLAATPIGNIADAPSRMIEHLRSADLVAAEDTRRMLRLAESLGVEIGGKILSYHDHSDNNRVNELIQAAQHGRIVLLVTDAGMPTVSDPGYRLVHAAVDAGVRLTVIPGPSAVLTALALSGLPTDRFTFEGFLPRKPGERSRRLHQLKHEVRTMVFFEAPHRLPAMLLALAETFDEERPVAVVREMTKTFEEVLRGTLAEAARWSEDTEIRGEIVVVVGGDRFGQEPSVLGTHIADALRLIASGMRVKDAVTTVAESAQVEKRRLYQAVLEARQ